MSEAALLPVIRIEPSRGLRALDLAELWRYRELLYFLVWRDIKVRYKQTLIGAAWAILQPLAGMIVFSLLFGRLVRIPIGDAPYPLFSYAGLLCWTYSSQALAEASRSLVDNGNLLRKIYFPRLAAPLAAVLWPSVDLLVALSLMMGLMFYYGIFPGFRLILLPAAWFLAAAVALSAGIWLAALNVRYRDVKYAVPFFLQFWLFLSPVIYPSSLLSGAWSFFYALNPMVGAIEFFRWCLLGLETDWTAVGVSLCVTVLGLALGLRYFLRMEKNFADWV